MNKKLALSIMGVIVSALGLLWFLQGAGFIHLRPILCFADCEYLSGISRPWELAGVITFMAGITIIIKSRRMKSHDKFPICNLSMLNMIRTHNYLNGNIFSAVEFLLTALTVGFFAIYYLLHGPWLYAIIAVGITLNCLSISSIAFLSLLKKEKSIGILQLYSNKDIRREVMVEHPKLSRETFILCVGVVLPYSLAIASLYDSLGEKIN